MIILDASNASRKGEGGMFESEEPDDEADEDEDHD